MNRDENRIENVPTDDTDLDRLVDGELTRDEYAAMLRSLEHTPDGWRRCALAFLEAQAWQRAIGETGRRRIEASDEDALEDVWTVPEPSTRRAPAKPATTKAVPLLLAVAASFLLLFGLGLVYRPGEPSEWLSRMAPLIAGYTAGSGAPTGTGESRASSEAAIASDIASAGPPARGNVTFVVDHGNEAGSREVAVPVYEWSTENEPWLTRGPMTPSFEMQRAVQRGGHDVRMHRHLIPLETGDGRHVLIPVEQMEITPAGRRVFQ